MRADDVSAIQATRPPTDPLVQKKNALLYELELDFRRVAKQLLRRRTPVAALLVRNPAASSDEADTWQDTGLRGWMIGPNFCLLDDGSWVPHVVGRTHKLDKPRHNFLFGDANTKRYAQEWQELTDVGVVPGAPYMRMEPEHVQLLNVAVEGTRAGLFGVERTHNAEVLTFSYPWGPERTRTDVVRDDLQRWVTGYLSE